MKDATEIILEGSRFWFQKVLVPIIVCLGVTGNTITVMVLTRRRMRSSTNIYLSALAIADIIYLFFVLMLSFTHYNNIHDGKYELYWRFYGLSHWLCDAASSTSVWLTVSFTIERYIAVCHPMRGKYLCTENRAKTVTVIVYILCLLTTASTTFEYQLSLSDTCTECPNCTECSRNLSTDARPLKFDNNNNTIHYIPNNIVLSKDITNSTIKVVDDPTLTATLKSILANCSTNHPHIIYVYPQTYNVTRERSLPDSTKVENFPNMTVVHEYLNEDHDDEKDMPLSNSSNIIKNTINNDHYEDLLNDTDTSNSTNITEITCCNHKLRIDVEDTNLGKHDVYRSFMNWYSALIFGLCPLVLIATFNCFLIRAVILSQRKRRTMTNSKSHTNSQENLTMTNENRITMMLIAVVVMFLICQTPTASFLIYSNFCRPETKREQRISNILGNVFNFLITVNASCNFLLYSTMSKKFRSTFKQLFFERGKKKRQDAYALSSTKSHNSQKFNPQYHAIKRNNSEYHTPRNLETQSLTSIPRSKSLMTRPNGKAKSTDLVV